MGMRNKNNPDLAIDVSGLSFSWHNHDPLLEIDCLQIKRGELMAKRKLLQTSIVEELNGQRVRIPGYLLPLEVSDTKVKEFLLVPYIGACIHVPPPPQNQIVHVKIILKEGYRVKTMYEPVWVSGEISVKSKDQWPLKNNDSADISLLGLCQIKFCLNFSRCKYKPRSLQII
jgi:hypothetical protein